MTNTQTQFTLPDVPDEDQRLVQALYVTQFDALIRHALAEGLEITVTVSLKDPRKPAQA